MFYKTEKKTVFRDNINLYKPDKKLNNATPNVTTKISAYDKVVSLVTNDDNSVTAKPEESNKQSNNSCLE